ncbi:FAD-binding protein [Desulfosarcina cetonica]|uniref:FAD-binding protein n=1 Tax=Desulfosarcina cetonica TaxID=90730 RepID=UPI001FEE6605|nr:FAD-binding protein [Desulfosarcina cetonica]
MTQQTQMETIKLSTDVLVVGAGMTGVKAATEIAANGYNVVLIDGGAPADTAIADVEGDEQAALDALLETAKHRTRSKCSPPPAWMVPPASPEISGYGCQATRTSSRNPWAPSWWPRNWSPAR